MYAVSAYIHNQDKVLKITWNDESVDEFPFFFLRDNCLCKRCLHPVTRQREVDTLQISMDILPKEVKLTEHTICIEWENHVSEFPFSWFQKKGSLKKEMEVPVLWNSEMIHNLPEIDFTEIHTDKGMNKWLSLIQIHGFAIVKNVPVTLEDTRQLIEKIGTPKSNIYGMFWDIAFQNSVDNPENIVDTAYGSDSLAPHTDGTYFYEPPGLQFFHFLEAAREGGETILVDGFKIAEDMKNENPQAFQFFSTQNIPFYHINGDKYFYQERKVFQLNEQGDIYRFSFNNSDRAPFYLPPLQLKFAYQHLHYLLSALSQPRNQLKFKMLPGSLLVTNNWRVMHARTAFKGKRRMVGSYMNFEDFQSKLITTRSNSTQ